MIIRSMAFFCGVLAAFEHRSKTFQSPCPAGKRAEKKSVGNFALCVRCVSHKDLLKNQALRERNFKNQVRTRKCVDDMRKRRSDWETRVHSYKMHAF